MLGEIGLTILTLGESQAIRTSTQTVTRTVVTNTVEEVAVNPKIYAQLEKQLSANGAASINKALQSSQRTLQQHVDKLSDLQYKSQVEGTIRNVKSQVETIKQFIKDKNL